MPHVKPEPREGSACSSGLAEGPGEAVQPHAPKGCVASGSLPGWDCLPPRSEPARQNRTQPRGGCARALLSPSRAGHQGTLPWERGAFGSHSPVSQLRHSTAKQGMHAKQSRVQQDKTTLQPPAESCTSIPPWCSLGTDPEESLAGLASTCCRAGDSAATAMAAPQEGPGRWRRRRAPQEEAQLFQELIECPIKAGHGNTREEHNATYRDLTGPVQRLHPVLQVLLIAGL